MKIAFAALGAVAISAAASAVQPDPARVAALADALDAHGQAPVDYVIEALDAHDLIVFDEGLHTAKEPWDFYADLVRDPRFAAKARFIFLEVIPYNQNKHFDAFLASEDGDLALAYPALQSALPTGWTYQTYLDFLAAVYEANRGKPEGERIRVIGVRPATYWSEIETLDDYRLYRTVGHAAYDYEMYAQIAFWLDGFESGEKGLFLTNTRHAYIGLRDNDGELFWNATTYLRERHGDKVWSVRFNAPFLEVTAREETEDLGQGLKGVTYGWTRADAGAWDAAFAQRGDEPVAIELADTPFGEAPYVGNRMLTAAPGQSMADVNDAVIHLKPIDNWTQTGFTGALFTDAFKAEAARRLRIVNTEDELAKRMSEEGAGTVEALVDAIAQPRAAEPLPQSADLPPL